MHELVQASNARPEWGSPQLSVTPTSIAIRELAAEIEALQSAVREIALEVQKLSTHHGKTLEEAARGAQSWPHPIK